MTTEKKYNKEILSSFISKQIYRCATNRYYIFGILISHSDKIKYIDTILEKLLSIEYGKYINVRRNSKNGINIEFLNGSIIDVVTCVEKQKGKKYHAIAIDNEIDDEIKQCYCYAKYLDYPCQLQIENEQEYKYKPLINNYKMDILEFKIIQ